MTFFQTTPQNVTLQLKAIFSEGELSDAATCKDYLQVGAEAGRQVSRNLRHYRLEAILAVGYRVRSHRGTQFWISRKPWPTSRIFPNWRNPSGRREASYEAPGLPAHQTQRRRMARRRARGDGKVEEAVERLQKYRTALITAVVTGKINVSKA